MDSDEEIQYPTVDEPAPAQYLKTQRGGRMLVDPYFYLYHKNKKTVNYTYWHCVEKRKEHSCKGIATTNDEDVIIKTTMHCHESDSTVVKVKESEQEILESVAKHPKLTTHHIMGEWKKATMAPEAQSVILSKMAFERKIKKVRATASGHQEVPREFEEFEDLPLKYQRTFDGDRFCIANIEMGGNDRLIVFSSNTGLKILQMSVTWTADGTFDIVQPPFKQLYSIMGEVEGISYPCLFAFMADKKATSYRALLEVVHEFVIEKGELHLKQIVCDFESPVLREFKSVFGKNIIQTGCVVHLARALRRQMGKIGDLLKWQKSHDFKIFCKCLRGLAYVPVPLVPEYFQALLQEELPKVLESLDNNPEVKAEEADRRKEAINSFLTYFERTYVGRQGRSGWLQGRFPIKIWNQHSNVLEGRQLSTNRHEGMHSR